MQKYALVTPARNEEEFIEGTIRSMISQTHLPVRWVIVSDGSTDQTEAIVRRYLPDHPWIQLVIRPKRQHRDFAGKVHCFNAGHGQLAGLEYDVVGNLDADLTFEPDYFEFLLSRFDIMPKLGVAGTPFVEGKVSYDYRFTNIEHVSGACQLFRRECYEAIGGYSPIAGGGIDWVAVTTARMKGWQTRTFLERSCLHHRPMGTATVGNFRALYKLGKQDYYLGGHFLWQVFRGAFQLTRRPWIIGGFCLFAGYCSAMLSRTPRSVSPELMEFHQGEQMLRLRNFFLRRKKQAS